MTNKEVLVRALGGQPIKMQAVLAANGLVYVANPKSMARVRQGESWPVGFPAEDVFEFDLGAFEELSAKWRAQGVLTREEWRVFRLTRATVH